MSALKRKIQTLLVQTPDKGRVAAAIEDVVKVELRKAKAEALREMANELAARTMPEHGSHINMTPYRDGVVDGVNRAIRDVTRRADEMEGEQG